jgi:N-acetylmuramoyl-L-alanine amidase
VPVVLAETGFLSNPAEGARLRSARYQARIARGLAEGAIAFLRSA